MVNVKKRIIYLDYLRALAIFGVIFNHISTLWKSAPVPNSSIALLYNSFGRIGVPLFLMLTGILLLNNKLSIGDFIKRRYPRVIKPFLFWMTLFIIYTLLVLHPRPIDGSFWFWVVEQYLSVRWYVWMILGCYLIIPIMASFIKGTKLEGVKYFLIIWLITTGLMTLSVFFNFKLHYLDLVIFSGPIGYLMLGYYLHNKKFNISAKKIVIISLIIFIVFTIIKFRYILDPSIMSYYNPQNLDRLSFRYLIFTTKSHLEIDTASIIQIAAIFLVVKYIPEVKSGLCKKISNIANKKTLLALIISISQASYGIYLCHYFIRDTLIFLQFPFTDLSSLIFVPVIAILILFIAYCMIIVISKIPVVGKLSGYH